MIKIATLWILSEDNEVLLAQRSFRKALDPGVWGPSVTGTLDPGESFDDALVREVEEELSLQAIHYTPRFLFETDYLHPDGRLRRFRTYVAQLPKLKTDLIRIDPDEVEAIRWFAVHEILEKMASAPHELVPSAQLVWPDTFRAIGLEIPTS